MLIPKVDTSRSQISFNKNTKSCCYFWHLFSNPQQQWWWRPTRPLTFPWTCNLVANWGKAGVLTYYLLRYLLLAICSNSSLPLRGPQPELQTNHLASVWTQSPDVCMLREKKLWCNSQHWGGCELPGAAVPPHLRRLPQEPSQRSQTHRDIYNTSHPLIFRLHGNAPTQ